MSTAAANQPLPFIDRITEEHICAIGILTVVRTTKPVRLPLSKVSISARVADRIAEVSMTETFQNPFQDHLEAVYTFPLPGSSAVSSFEMKVGNRTIKGKVEERGEARRQYQQALDQGKRAALLEQERDDVFTVQVGNLPPGEEVTVRLTYSERLPFFEDGTTELRLPLVVASRYIPGSPIGRDQVGEGIEEDTDIVSDASRISPPRLAPGFDPQIGCSIGVELIRPRAKGRESDIVDLCCSQHAVQTKTDSGAVQIQLARETERLNRDFVLRWRLAETFVKPAFLLHRNPEGQSFGLISIVPPRRDVFLGTPRDVVFVVDRSGSMEGIKMTSAARACGVLLRTLGPRDRFAIQAFDDRVEWFTPHTENRNDFFSQADEAGIDRGEKYLRQINSRGGTELDRALSDAIIAISRRSERTGRIPVIVLLTDGQIGDESRVLKRIQQEIGESRVFTIGIDTAVNEGFLRRLATLGGGTATFVQPGTQLEDALRAVGQEIGTPLVVDVTVEDVDSGLDASSIAPGRIPDLFAGRATTAFFQLRKPGRVRVKGRYTDGKQFEEILEGQEIELPALAQLWAKTRVVELEDRFRVETHNRDTLKKQIVELAVHHSILTKFTAFVVVDESEIVNQGGSRRKIAQPVEMPDQWEMNLGASPTLTGGGVMMAGMIPPPSPAPMPPIWEAKAMSPSPPVFQAPGAPMPRSQNAPRPESSAKSSGPSVGNVAEGLFDLLGDVLQTTAGKLSEALSGKDKEKTQSQAILRPPQPKPDAFEPAFSNLVKAFTETHHAVAAGRVPTADALEKARTGLLNVLAGSDLGTQLPELQRFLRSTLVELVAALNLAGITANILLPLFERHQKTFEAVQAEAKPFLTQPVQPSPNPGGRKDGSFWDSNI